MRILLINGYTPHPDAGGKLTQSLIDLSLAELEAHHTLKQSTVISYDADAEYEKFKWADLVLMYFPLYWYAVPWGLKRYIDDVFAMHTFYDSDDNGRPVPLMTGKTWGYVTTLAAVESTYAPNNLLTGGLSVADLLQPLTVTFRYVGIQPSSAFSNQVYYDVYNPEQVKQLRLSLKQALTQL